MLELSSEVATAISTGQPVVALESTIISHGMPYPQNIETASAVEHAVRTGGAIPATIAVADGKLKVGLSAGEIAELGKIGPQAIKCSRRDLPFVIARKLHGATTVAATMIIAAKAGIKVFATGGIGGVHRGVEDTLDISADLDELGRTDVIVVCAGIKSILDIPRSLEYLETKGVPVIGYRTAELPAFYARSSGCAVDYRVDSAAELAAAVLAKQQLGLGGGMLIGVFGILSGILYTAGPFPLAYVGLGDLFVLLFFGIAAVAGTYYPHEHALDSKEIDAVIADAILEMQRRGIHGKETTPYLLASIAERTDGKSLDANIQLILNNARVAAELAVTLHQT